MWKIIRAWFAWKAIRDAGVYRYSENTVTGQRMVSRWNSGGFSPIDMQWLEAGKGKAIIRF